MYTEWMPSLDTFIWKLFKWLNNTAKIQLFAKATKADLEKQLKSY